MFKRVIFENWTEHIPEISFWLTFSVFILMVLKTLLMKRSEVERISHLPLEDTEEPENECQSQKLRHLEKKSQTK